MPAPRLPAAAAPRCVASLLAGSDSSAWRRWLDLLDVRGSWLVWDGGIPRPPGRRPRPAASLRSLRAALENASRFLSFAPLRVRIPPLVHKKVPRADESPGRSVTLAGTEGFEPPTAGTKNRSSTVELRPSMGVAKSNSFSLPNLRGHRKRRRAGARRVSGHRLR